MEYRLAGARAVGLGEVDAVGRDRLVDRGGYPLRGLDDRAEELGRHLVEVLPVLLGDRQRVAGIGRVDVHEGERRRVLVELEARDGARDDLAEDAVGIGAHRLLPQNALLP